LLGLISKVFTFLKKSGKNEVQEQETKENLAAKNNKRLKILKKTNGLCAYCGVKLTIESMKATCVIPLSRGGSDRVQNKLPACRICNKKKGNLTHEEFLENRKGQVQGKRKIVYEKTAGHCAYCGAELGKFKKMTIDHVVPLSLEGGNGVENMLPACFSCNQAKGALTVEQFRAASNKTAKEVHLNLMNSNPAYKNAVRMGAVKIQNVAFFFEQNNIKIDQEQNKDTAPTLPEPKEGYAAMPELQEDLVIFLGGGNRRY